MPPLLRILATVSGLLACAGSASAHDVPGSAVYFDMQGSAATVHMDLPLVELELALPASLRASLKPDLALATPAGAALVRYVDAHFHVEDANGKRLRQRADSLAIRRVGDGDCLVLRLRLDATAANLASFRVYDTAISHQVASHKIYVFLRRDFRQGLVGDNPLLVGVLFPWSEALLVQRQPGRWWSGAGAFFVTGMRHIAQGADHLLFLLSLLLIAPLKCRDGRWREAEPIRAGLRRTLIMVTGFTLGHSLTLALASLGTLALPVRAIEVLVAVSILIAAAHAIRAIYPGYELWIASGFGLVHGLAFAEALTGFGYSSGVLVLSLLSFNLGIEAMQVAVIAVCLPWLMLLARTPWYAAVRIPIALASIVAAGGWIAALAFGLPNPMEHGIAVLLQHALWLPVAIAALSLLMAGTTIANRR